MNHSNLQFLADQKEIIIDLIINLCNINSKKPCEEQRWDWWLTKIGSILICMIGISANLVCVYLFRALKSIKSSYIFYLKFLCISDTICLTMELIKSLNQISAQKYSSNSYNDVNCKLLEFLTASFHLASAWLICAFSVERCLAVIWPLLIRQLMNIHKTKIICMIIFTVAPSIQLVRLFLVTSTCSLDVSSYLHTPHNSTILSEMLFDIQVNLDAVNNHCSSKCKCATLPNRYGKFMLKYHSYFHQLVCLVIIPSVIVITCNSVVFYQILKRRRMIKTGKFYDFKINKTQQQQSQQAQQPQQQQVPMIKVTRCNSNEPVVSLQQESDANQENNNPARTRNSRVSLKNRNPMPFKPNQMGGKLDAESLNSYEDIEMASYSTTYEESKSLDSRNVNNSINKVNKNRLNKRNRHIKLALLMLFSGSFLVFVLPEALLNIYEFNYFENQFLNNYKNLVIEDHVHKNQYLDFNNLIRTYFAKSKTTMFDHGLGKIKLSKSICYQYHIDRFYLLFELFLMLKLCYFSSNFLAYLTLITFSKGKRNEI